MQVFQIKLPIILILSVSLLGGSTFISNTSAQEEKQIPIWIKDVAKWWSNDEISEKEFLTGIEYLINNNIISLDSIPCGLLGTSSTEQVPTWFKNNAKWWSENLIGETEFLNGIEYLIKKQIISIDNKKIVGEIPVELVQFSSAWIAEKNYLSFVQSSFFEVYGNQGDCGITENGDLIWQSLVLGLNPDKKNMYSKVANWNDSQKAVVVYPFFTYTAYNEPGFYTYYRGECESCTTTSFAQPKPVYTSSGMGHQALTLLGYPTLTDIEIDKNPSILQQFDKVIMLHNEYVTRTMFDAITNHPNVIYLYPNALYAEIEVDYTAKTMTLTRGHNYPEPEIKNGFDWEFDNTHPYEYDNTCLDMQFYEIKNGWMTTCYPENVFLQNSELLFTLLKTIKDL